MAKSLKGKELGIGYSQDKNGYYVYRYTDENGSRKTLKNKKLTELRAKVKDLLIEEDKFKNRQKTSKTLNDMFKITFDVYRCSTLKRNTLMSYKDHYMNHVFDTDLGRKYITDIKPVDVQMLLNSLSINYCQSTCRTMRSTLLNIFDVCVIEGIIQYNFISSIKAKSIKKSKKIEPLTLEEQSLFEKYVDNSIHSNLYMLVLNTGLRCGEVCALTLDDIDFEKKILKVNKQIVWESSSNNWYIDDPKDDSIREIPLNDNACQILYNQIEFMKIRNSESTVNPFKKYLFLNKRKQLLNRAAFKSDINNLIKNINKCEGTNLQPFGIHVLRHTFATRCAEAGVQPNKLRLLLGHKNINVTMRIYVGEKAEYTDVALINKSIKPQFKNVVIN